jgi:hypothetical protein
MRLRKSIHRPTAGGSTKCSTPAPIATCSRTGAERGPGARTTSRALGPNPDRVPRKPAHHRREHRREGRAQAQRPPTSASDTARYSRLTLPGICFARQGGTDVRCLRRGVEEKARGVRRCLGNSAARRGARRGWRSSSETGCGGGAPARASGRSGQGGGELAPGSAVRCLRRGFLCDLERLCQLPVRLAAEAA